MSWMVISHVEDGRSVLNFTEWGYSPEEGADLMDSVCAQVKRGRMPLARIHLDALARQLDGRRDQAHLRVVERNRR